LPPYDLKKGLDSKLADAPQAMPEQYKVPGDPVKAYRNYYMGEKRHFASWTHRRPPEWWSWHTKDQK